MKTLTINIHIPTSWKDIRVATKEKINSRYRNNIEAVVSLSKNIKREINRSYWGNDMTVFMKKEIIRYIDEELNKTILKLK